MSELAFNLNGEPLEFPPNAVGLRVRRLEKGAPKTVYSKEGTPLTLPLDAEMADLRREVRGAEGRYRLDPVDDGNRSIVNGPAAYVYVHPAEPVDAPVHHAAHGPSDPVVEAMRMNTELARTVVDKFPLMMESAAGLLRAASDAGLPTRLPRILFEAPADPDGDDEGMEDESSGASWLDRLQKLLPYVGPLLSAASAHGILKIPGGVGALLDCRRASAAGGAAANPPGAAPAPGPTDPAPARLARAAGAAVGLTAPAAAKARAQASRTPGAVSSEAATREEAPAAVTPVPPGLPTLDAASLAHFAAIEAELTLEERMFAHALVAELTPEQLRGWLTQLMPLSIPEALAKIRAVLGPNLGGVAGASGSPVVPGLPGGAS